MNKKVYFISGLGADERIFKHIRLPEQFSAVQLSWIKPQPSESMESYSRRMATGINVSEKFYLVGLSLGGMIASEMSGFLNPEKTILISSIPSIDFLPWYYRISRVLLIHKWLPISMIKHAAWVKRFFSPETSEDKVMLKKMIRDCDPSFIRWGFHAILTWKSKNIPQNLVSIHGTSDKIIPINYIRPTHVIKRGGHLMVLNRAEEINAILETVLK